MGETLDVIATLLTAVVLVTCAAHALERPGKARLGREEYRVVQQIYYPGFTLAGAVNEIPSIIVTAVAVIVAGVAGDSREVVLGAVALLALVGVHVAYWLIVHPVNRFWVHDVDVDQMSSRFFGSIRRAGRDQTQAASWTQLRDRWESGHLIRTVLASIALLALVISLA